ncbi:hypothetical protein [Streptomyces laurentii]
MPADSLFLLPLAVVALGFLCTTGVCVVALLRADRTDTVRVVRALPELAATLLRLRRRPRR